MAAASSALPVIMPLHTYLRGPETASIEIHPFQTPKREVFQNLILICKLVL